MLRCAHNGLPAADTHQPQTSTCRYAASSGSSPSSTSSPASSPPAPAPDPDPAAAGAAPAAWLAAVPAQHACTTWRQDTYTAFSDAGRMLQCAQLQSVSTQQMAAGPSQICSTHRLPLGRFGSASCQLLLPLHRLHCCGQLLHHLLLLPPLLQRLQLPLQLSQHPPLGAAVAAGSVCTV